MKYIKEAIKIFFEKKNMIYFFKIYSVAFALGLTSFIFSFVVTNKPMVYLPSIILFPIGLWVQASGYEAVKRVVDGGVFEFKDTYKTAWRYLWRFFLISFLVGLIIIGGAILFIVPAVIFGTWYAFSLWGLVDKNYRVGQALRESKALVKDRFWKVLGRFLVFTLFAISTQIVFSLIPYGVGSLIITIFGGLFLLPYYLLYRELSVDNI